MEKYILAIDQGTTSTRAILFNHQGENVAMERKTFKQYFPKPGWVEQDAEEIWQSVLFVVKKVLAKQKLSPQQIAAIGITNQRETTVVWDKESGKPLYHAIVWQSRQSQEITNKLVKAGYKKQIQEKTGLVIDPYFSASKIKWILDEVKGARKMAKEDKLLFGTIDSWLVWKLSEGKLHITDYSNASRTMLFNINSLKWDEELLELFDIPSSMLPAVRLSSEIYGYTTIFGGKIPLAAIIGDQQASLFGQCCYEKGDIKNTYGTGCFMLMNTGDKPVYSKNGLLTTIAWALDEKIEYALEGSVYVGGSVIQWLKEGLEIIESVNASEEWATSVTTCDGVYFVPAFVGLGTPYWDEKARGGVFGLTRGTTKAHLVRAAIEAIAFQSKDVMDIMELESGADIKRLAVDGGVTSNNFLMQFQSDIMMIEIALTNVLETTALGAAALAGLACGFFKSQEEIKQFHHIIKVYEPKRSKEQVERIYRGWKKAVEATRVFK